MDWESALAELVVKLLGMAVLVLGGSQIQKQKDWAEDAEDEAAALERVARADASVRDQSDADKLRYLQQQGLLRDLPKS